MTCQTGSDLQLTSEFKCWEQKAAQINEEPVFEVIVVGLQTFTMQCFTLELGQPENIVVLTNGEAMLMHVEYAIESCTFANFGNHNHE